MKKTLIRLCGTEGTGKTHTIHKAHELLCNKYEAIYVHGPDKCGKDDDLKAIIEINGIRIGFFGVGDPGKGGHIQTALDCFNAKGCDIIICVTRTKRATKVVVDNFHQNNGFDLFSIKKCSGGSESTAQNKSDEHTANEIVAKVIELLPN